MPNLFRFLLIRKRALKKVWAFKESIKVFYNYLFISNKNCLKLPKLYYGGSLKGNVGGPLVKIKKLNKIFPEHHWKFNIVYLLSNSIYLNSSSINLIKKKKLPIILNQNGVFYPEWFKGNWEKENNKMSLIYHSADYIFWQSKFCRDASEKFLGKRYGEGEILYNAVDTSLFRPAANSKNKNFTFLITGNIRKRNNYRILNVLYAIKDMVKENNLIFLKIAGYIEDRNYFLSKINELKLENHISFLKKYSQNDAPIIYKSADAYITLSYQDNCPTAVLEAMACGLPILYSASGGIPELVDKNSGVGLKVLENWEITQIPKTSDIKKGMKEIIENKTKMSEASRKRAVEIFDIKNWIKKHYSLFEKLLDNKKI